MIELSDNNNIFSYTHRDYEGSRQEGLSHIPILSKGTWTDLNATDPGIIILDYVHALVDMMNYYQDHQALESFLPTVKERANIFRIARQLSYNIRSAKGALCDVTFTSPIIYDHPVKIPKYTSVSTSNGIHYLTKEDAYLQTGKSSVIVQCSQGTIGTRVYTGTGISRYSDEVSAQNQVVLLPITNIDTDTISVVDNIGRIWTNVDTLIFSEPTSTVYHAELNPDDTVSIKFGDGERGVVPGTTDVFTITYIITDAEKGRVDKNSLIILDDEIIDSGKYVDFIVSNVHASTGGSASQSSEDIKELAPGIIKSQDRAVTLSDFEYLAKRVDGVADAKAYDINTNPDICLYHEVKVLIVPEDSNPDTVSLLKDEVNTYLSTRILPPTNLQVLTPSYVPIDITVSVKGVDGYKEGGLEYQVYDAVSNYFKNRRTAIGEDFYPADLSATISNLANVRYVVSMIPNTVVQISDFSIATLGELTISIQ